MLRYDPLGPLCEVVGSTSGTTRFHYDGDAMVAEYDSGGTMLRRYVHGPAEGVDDPMVWFEGASVADGARRYLFADERGSIVAVTDGNGIKLAINSYDEYGIPASANQGRFQYTGQAWLPELGMYYVKARIYSPTLDRFLQTDPIGYEDQINPYGYVANDPVHKTDPTGEELVGALIGGVTGADLDYATQVAGNLVEGKNLGESLTQVDRGSIIISAVGGAVAGATGVGTVSLARKGVNAFKEIKEAKRALTIAKDAAQTSVGKRVHATEAASRASEANSAVKKAVIATAAIKGVVKTEKKEEKKEKTDYQQCHK